MDGSGFDLVQTGVLGVVVLAIVVGGLKKVWLFYWVHDQIVRGLLKDLERERAEKEEWKGFALDSAGLVRETVDRATRVVARAASASDDPSEDGS